MRIVDRPGVAHKQRTAAGSAQQYIRRQEVFRYTFAVSRQFVVGPHVVEHPGVAHKQRTAAGSAQQYIRRQEVFRYTFAVCRH